MKFKSEYSERAKLELLDAWIWYEKQQPFLGDKFKKYIDEKIEQIEKAPDRYPERRKSFRETPVKTFPFLILFRLIEKERRIIIVSIFHTSRNPKVKYKK